MTNIITYYLFVQLILNLFFKPDYSILQCGLSGFSGKKGLTKAQLAKVWANMKLLGLYNQSRGTTGCGLLINGELIKGGIEPAGVPDTKLMMELLAKHADLEYKGGTILMHSRQMTVGAGTRENNHPFLITNYAEDPTKNFHLCHNGSIKNTYELGKKCDVKYTDYDVDSQCLGMCIDRLGFDILKDYEGFAALMFTYAGTPDDLYVYHGKYCEHPGEAEEKAVEERPLYCLETPEGMYLSSMESSLRAISEAGQVVQYVEYNCVFRIRNGKWTSFKHPVDRLYGPNTKPVYVYQQRPTYNHNTRNQNIQGTIWNGTSWESEDAYEVMLNPNRGIATNLQDTTTDTPRSNKIWSEAPPYQAREVEKPRVYFWRGRYYKTGNGSSVYNNLLCHGILWLDTKGHIGLATDANTALYYFYEGTMLKGAVSYNELMAEDKLPKGLTKDPNINWACVLSRWSQYPVTNNTGQSSKEGFHTRFGFYLNNKRCRRKDSFSPKFSSRRYVISNDGFLSDITTSDAVNDSKIFYIEQQTKATSNFDTVFEDEDIAFKTFSDSEMKSIFMFIEDLVWKSSSLDPDSKEIFDEVFSMLVKAGLAKTTIREELEDWENKLDLYEKGIVRIGKQPRFTKQRAVQAGHTLKEGFHFDNILEEWVMTIDPRVQKQCKLWFKEFMANTGSETQQVPTEGLIKIKMVDWDNTIVETWNQDSIGYTKDNERILVDSEGFQYIVRNGQGIYTKCSTEQYKILEHRFAAPVEDMEEIFDQDVPNYSGLIGDTEAEDFEVEDEVEKMIIVLGEINSIADKLSGILTNNYAQEVSVKLYKMLENIKHGLAEVSDEFKKVEITQLINKTITTSNV